MHSYGRRVVVYLSDFHTRTTERGGRPQDNLRRKGLVRWSDPLVHTVENIGKIEGHVISVELREGVGDRGSGYGVHLACSLEAR